MKNEFALAFNEVLEEKQLPKEIILKALESAMVAAYRKAVNASAQQQIEARIDPDTGKVIIFAEKEVVETVVSDLTEVSLVDAVRTNPEAQIGETVIVESTPQDFGRVAAQTARQVIQQRIRDAERAAQVDFYAKQVGEIVSGVIQAMNANGLTIGMEMKAEGIMTRKDMIPGERFRMGDRVRGLVAEVKESTRGPQILISRTHKDFLRRLLENEVPEIYHGVVEIRSISREPGERAKVAVSSTQPGIDPVGACVGLRGVRIQAIVGELHNEKIDVIEWLPDPAAFIAKALSPAKVTGVYLNERSANGKTATVVVMEDQLSLAIGREGQNARLAAKLTSWRIDIKSLIEAAGDAIHKLQTDETLASFAASEAENIPVIQDMLARKAENRPLMPEEYDVLVKFVDRVERRVAYRAPVEKPAEAVIEVSSTIKENVAAEIYNQNILDSGLPDHVANLLQGAGYETTGALLEQFSARPDAILGLQGIGPRSMNQIKILVDKLLAVPEVVAPVVEVVAETPVEQVVTPVEPEVVETAVVETPAEEAVPEVIDLSTFDTIAGQLAAFTPSSADLGEEEEGDPSKVDQAGKKKSKKHKPVQIEYDPDRDITFVHKKHRRGEDGDEW
jgi:transcription termination/antitermination protein NusA